MTKSNLLVFKGGKTKENLAKNKFGIGASVVYGVIETAHISSKTFNMLQRMARSTSAEEVEELRQFDMKSAYDNFPEFGDEIRFDKLDLAVQHVSLGQIASGAMIAKDFYNDSEAGDSLMELANYCYQSGIVRVALSEIPSNLLGFLINLKEDCGNEGCAYRTLMFTYTGSDTDFQSGWRHDGSAQAYRDSRQRVGGIW